MSIATANATIELIHRARTAVAIRCLNGIHEGCLVLGYFEELKAALGNTGDVRWLQTECRKCHAMVRIWG
jgi:hypothetical protein